jgi:hypothetical protein
LKTSFLLVLASLFFVSTASAQTISGEWYGVGQVKRPGDHNNYLSELILKRTGKKVTGQFNYYFRTATINTKITGTYDSRYRLLELKANPILNYQAKNVNGADCPMEGSFTLRIYDGDTTLEGQFNPIYDYRLTCPAINIRFVKSNPAKDQQQDVAKDEIDGEDSSAFKIDKPAVKKPDGLKRTTAIDRGVATVKTDTAKRTEIKRPAVINKPLSEEQKISLALKQRTFDVSPIIDVDADSLKVSLYDNGEVDNDSISIFYNRKLVAAKQMLSDKPLMYTFPLDSSINEIAMYAENLGKIPPNTALAVIYAGDQRFELNLTSTYSKNAAIRFRKKVKHVDPKNIN